MRSEESNRGDKKEAIKMKLNDGRVSLQNNKARAPDSDTRHTKSVVVVKVLRQKERTIPTESIPRVSQVDIWMFSDPYGRH